MTNLQILHLILGLCALVLAYVYVLFPLAMGFIGNRAESVAEGENLSPADVPHISLIIPAYNEQAIIESKIRNTLELDYPQHLIEVIVACDGVTDATAEIAGRFRSDRLRVLDFASRRGKACVINDAAAESIGQVLCLCDANVMFAPDVLRRMIVHLKASDVGAVSGDVRLDSANSSFGSAESLYYWIERSIHRGESRLGSMMGVDGGMYIIRRELFQPLPADTILDDFTVSMHVIRHHHRIKYEPSAVAFENATEAATTEFNRRVRLSSGAAQVILRRHVPTITQPVEFLTFVSHKFLRWISPFIILIGVTILFIVALHDPLYRIAMWVLVLLVALAILGAVSRRSAAAQCLPCHSISQ